MAEVLQCDRDAAAFLFSAPDDAACRVGRLDHTQAVQAFAAHREAAEKAERQAVVDWAKERAVKSFHADARAAWAKIADIVERGDHRKG